MDTQNNNSNQRGGLTVPSTPPVLGRSQTRTRWAALFDECRSEPGVWRRTVEPFRPTTAAQLESVIRNAWRRGPKKMRLRGLLEGERWEAVCGPAPESADTEECFVWLRFVSGSAGVEDGPTLLPRADEPVEAIEYAW